MSLLLAAAATLVFCAPGYPGGAADAQPFVDQFAGAAATAAGWPAGSLAAVYDPTEQGGLERLSAADTVLAFVPFPFFVEHAERLHLVPIAQADVVGTGTKQRWTLVVKAGGSNSAAALGGFTILSIAGYSQNFVRHSALGASGMPPDVKIEATGQILSALRKVASGQPYAALLDQPQAAALATLPFASDLHTLTQSPELPVAYVVVVGSRLPEAKIRSFQAGLLKLGHSAGASEALASLRLQGFVLPQLAGRPGP